MEIAIVLFNGIAPLDAVGPFEVLRNVPGWNVGTVGAAKGEVRAEGGSLALVADHALAEVTRADVVLVPGGRGTRELLEDEELLGWLRRIDATSKWTTSVCTGSLLLGAAGLLRGRRATTNWLLLDALSKFGAEPVGGRWVQDGKVLTAAGVTAGIDMALHLVATEAGPEVAQAVQLGIEYDPDPPFDSGSPQKAAPEIVELVRSAAAASGDPLLSRG
ncbi:MAG TPA: DJ-1/PfpI family protein [Solirubrobacterales bacterium]|jgi:transcriptional regulator GlxA family with amidase domain|nr:DJ-1/PfpI family protein [Solirubrobacterales bacterium]